MKLRFVKMHSCGNDFMVLDGINDAIQLTTEKIQQLAQRHTGVGFDQLLLVEASPDKSADFFYRIFNADGKEVGQCANGVRCLGHFLRYKGLTTQQRVTVKTRTTHMKLSLEALDKITVFLPPPKLHPNDIPLKVSAHTSHYSLPLAIKDCSGVTPYQDLHAVNVGNPHAVIKVDSLEDLPINALGKTISEHPWFPMQTNVGFMVWQDPNHLRLRVYERGCGETLACGSGAVAAAVISRLYYGGAESIEVSLPGGQLTVRWPTTESFIALEGPTTLVYEGTLIE